MTRSGAESDRIVRAPASRASLDRSAAGLVVGIHVRVRAVVLCK